MKFLKKFLKIILALIVLLGISLWLFINYLQPKYTGEIVLQNTLEDVSVYFDDYGVPHIYAKNDRDALTALGYVHAQERLWQMELLKRIVPGKLSEIFGDTMLKNDLFFSTLGLDQYNEEIVKNLDKNTTEYKQMQAYLTGVNQFIKEGPTPIEFRLLGIKKQPLTMVDVYNIIGYMAFSFAQAQKTDPLLSVLQEKLGDAYINQLGITISPNTTLIKNFKNKSSQASKMLSQISQVIEKTPFPVLTGSNSWVVNGKKSASGKVLFANDPHIGFSQPAVWYEAHVNYPGYEMYGYHIAGIPFPLLGHNHNFAYGLTMFQNDDLDFYAEEVNLEDTTLYKTATGFKKFRFRKKVLKIKDRKDTTITIKSSHHGPIINAVLDPSGSQPIAMSWIYTNIKNDVINALFTLSQAKDMQSFKKGASMIHAPGLNVMYGDAAGNIAWWASAKLYKLKSNVNRKFILDGASGINDTIEYLDFSENPMAENPAWNYVYSANNQPDSIAGMLYPGYYIPEDRAKRIVTLLEKSNTWDKFGFMKMINDATSSVAQQNIKAFTEEIDYNLFSKQQQKAIDILQQWDGNNTLHAVAPTIYNKWIYLYLKNTFEDEMGSELFAAFLQTHLSKRVVASQIQKDSSIWWDNIITKDVKETRKEILSNALIEAVNQLENQLGPTISSWTWDKVHTLEHAHPIGSIKLLRKYFNVGPFAVNGSREVINNLMFDYNESGVYKVPAGPSTRRVIDFSDIENSMSILPTGQSGVPFSKHYKDQAVMYIKGEFRKMKLNEDEIIKTSTLLKFKPK
jgi:penicillin amidase